jgi:hypothetical protein
MVEQGRGHSSLLMSSLLSLRVGVFFSWGKEGLLFGVGAGAEGTSAACGLGVFFFLGLFATVAQEKAGTPGGGLEVGGGRGRAGVDPGFGAGEGDGGVSFTSILRSRISLLRASIWAKRRSVLVL